MSRGFWFLAGAGAGVYAMVRGRRVAEAFTIEGMSDRVGALALGARLFRDEVAQGMADAEPAIRERVAGGLDEPAGPETPSGLDTPSLVPREGYATSEGGAALAPADRHDTDEEEKEHR